MLYRFLFFFGLLLSLSQMEGKVSVDLSHPSALIIDTDADLDDMMAILYLLKTPRIDIKAITTVGIGTTHWENGAKNISNLLELADRSRIPVAYGARKSLSPAGSVPKDWRLEADKVGGIKLPTNPVQPVRVQASEFIAEIIQKSPIKITILCIGPMTNVAKALMETPEIKENIERIYIMGGAISTAGNIAGRPQGFRNQVAEYNIFLDAKAASDVFDSGLPITLIPLDVTESVPITKEFFERLRLSKHSNTSAANFVYELIKPYATMQKKSLNYFWDPLAAVIMTHPEIANYHDKKLTVNLKVGPEYGRLMVTKMGSNIQVVTSVDSKAFYDLFLETLNRPTNLKQNHNESK